jgi:hypothetical protein
VTRARDTGATAGARAPDLYSQIKPDPRLVQLIDYAIEEITPHLTRKEYASWLEWADSWKRGERSPRSCVDAANRCFNQKEQLVWHTLGQIAWGAKEACYSAPKSGWLVIRYVADAMVAFGVAFPEDPTRLLETSPKAEGEP